MQAGTASVKMPSLDENFNCTLLHPGSTTKRNGGGVSEMAYKRCGCCPFGYHIDRDFVPFSKKMLSREGNMEKLQELKEKWRSERQSMDNLLGIPTEPWQVKTLSKPNKDIWRNDLTETKSEKVQSLDSREEASTLQNFTFGTELDQAVSEFEVVLARAKAHPKLICSGDTKYHTFPRIVGRDAKSKANMRTTTLVVTKRSEASATRNKSIESEKETAFISAERMVADAEERISTLEEQLCLISELQARISFLCEEKAKYIELLGTEKAKRWELEKELNCQRLSQEKDRQLFIEAPSPISSKRKDACVGNNVLTRDIGICYVQVRTRSIGVGGRAEGSVSDRDSASPTGSQSGRRRGRTFETGIQVNESELPSKDSSPPVLMITERSDFGGQTDEWIPSIPRRNFPQKHDLGVQTSLVKRRNFGGQTDPEDRTRIPPPKHSHQRNELGVQTSIVERNTLGAQTDLVGRDDFGSQTDLIEQIEFGSQTQDDSQENFNYILTESTSDNAIMASPYLTSTPVDLSMSTIPEKRETVKPSKGMQAALKVLNDALLRGSTTERVTSAIGVILHEWFRVSSSKNANALDVEDYLDFFESYSPELLKYIVNMPDGNGNSAIHYAVSHGNFNVASVLMNSNCCDINRANNAGYTCIMLLALANLSAHADRAIVRRLCSIGDVNIKAKQHGQTALMLAASHGRLETFQMLVDAGADLNIQDDDGSTALMCAAEHGHHDLILFMVIHPDCDLFITDNDGSTAVNVALEAGQKDIAVTLYAHMHLLDSPNSRRRLSYPPGTASSRSSPIPYRCSTNDSPNSTNYVIPPGTGTGPWTDGIPGPDDYPIKK